MAAKFVFPEVLREPKIFDGMKILDCHFDMKDPASAHEEYKKEHLPGAAHFRVEKSGRKTEMVMREFLSEAEFQDFARSLGINNGDKVVLYDRTPHGVGPAARAWYVLTCYGLKDVSILYGGLSGWKTVGGEVETGEHVPEPGNVTVKLSFDKTVSVEEAGDIARGLDADHKLVDAREPSMHSEKHIKGAVNIPLSTFLENGKVMPGASIAAVAAKKGIGRGATAVTYCNSALMSSAVMFVLSHGGLDVKNYNGAMFEFARKNADLLAQSV